MRSDYGLNQQGSNSKNNAFPRHILFQHFIIHFKLTV